MAARVRGASAASVFATLRNLERYPELCPAVRSVEVLEQDDAGLIARWDVSFRDGFLRWKEQEVFLEDQQVIRFKQLEGDAERFEGEWGARDDDGGCLVWYRAYLDLGVPGMEDMIEPVAELALRESIEAILRGLLGEGVEFL